MDQEMTLDAKNGDAFLISETMVLEEQKLLEERIKEEENNNARQAHQLNDTQFNKLDELLTQTQLYSEFLLEKMDDITKVSISFLEALHMSCYVEMSVAN